MKARAIINHRIVLTFLTALLTFGSLAAHGYHDTLRIYVNGARLTPSQIHQAEQMVGMRLPSGYYWYNANTGYWGLVGGPALGRIPGIWSQGNTVTESYPNGGAASRNSNVGIGIITDGQGGAFITD